MTTPQVLTGNETLYITGQDNTGNQAATTEIVRSSHIAGSGTRATATTTNFASTTTLANIAGLSVSLLAGITYSIEAAIPVTAGSSGGVSVGINTSDTLTLTSLNLTGKFLLAAGIEVVNTTTTTLGTALGYTGSVLMAELAGTLVVNAAGTLVLQAAQNASNSTTTSILPNGWLRVNKIT